MKPHAVRLRHAVRDNELLDRLENLRQRPFKGVVWRSVREGADPTVCSNSGGRWDDGSLDVLYTSDNREGALAERRFHLYQGQPFPPSNLQYGLFELAVELNNVIEFESLSALQDFGLREAQFGQLRYIDRTLEYRQSQEIAEASAFLGADGLRVPNARDISSTNLIIFCEQPTPFEINVERNHGLIDLSKM